MHRRNFIKMTGLGSTSLAVTNATLASVLKPSDATIQIDPKPVFDLSPYLYMQFMEPLGTTDSSVEAAWDHNTDKWKDTIINVTKKLAPGMMRWEVTLVHIINGKKELVREIKGYPC